MEPFGIAMFPKYHIRKGAQLLKEGDTVSSKWCSNRGEAVTLVAGDTKGHVTGVLTTEVFIASVQGRIPARIPVVPYNHNTSFPLNVGQSLRYFLSSSSR